MACNHSNHNTYRTLGSRDRWHTQKEGDGSQGIPLEPERAHDTLRRSPQSRSGLPAKEESDLPCMQVQGFAAALAMLDDHESSGPPDGVVSVYEGARYRKKKLGASGRATKDEKDEEQHTQRERERMMLGL